MILTHVIGTTSAASPPAEPGSTVIAAANFPAELARSRRTAHSFHNFFGTDASSLDVIPDRLIAAPGTLRVAGIELALIPGKSGETDDALFVRDLRHDILFVGDAFMPYSGAPFVAEGSAEGYLDAITQVLELHPRRLVHGHPPLTAVFTIEATCSPPRTTWRAWPSSACAPPRPDGQRGSHEGIRSTPTGPWSSSWAPIAVDSLTVAGPAPRPPLPHPGS